MEKKVKEATNYLKGLINIKPEIGLILGSGLGIMAESIKNKKNIKYKDIPDFPVSTVEGHAGQLITGKLKGKRVIAMQGRFHYYEGYSMQEITFPVRVIISLGIKNLIITNAAGGINLNYSPGELMIISDHINFMGDNPLRGENIDEFGPRFPDMSEAYSESLIQIAEHVSLKTKILTRKGIYIGVHGPSYETPAEINFFRKMGADAVGMSTVPEVIVANHMGLDVLGISCITNMAAGVLPEPLNHEEVMKIAKKVKPKFIEFVKGILTEI